ncbi:MAG: MBL fold metallo-hydrolase [Agitococcus sp.]|nr:MBL fold metallo-hydrolase [Agitococcus sp.]
MLKTLFLTAIAAFASTTTYAVESPTTPTKTTSPVSFAIIKTAKLPVAEGLVFSGGSLLKKVDSNFSAFLVRHGDSTFLFDAGLGNKVAEQYQQDMPLWQRLFFKYDDPVSSARSQLDRAGIAPVKTIILSHSHWDHASGISDFPDATVLAPEAEMAIIRHPTTGVGGSWPSQVAAKTIKWKTLEFKPVAYENFDRSVDLFGDGSIVLVPLFGHTVGSVGMFVTVDSGKRYFFVGDAVWNAQALKKGSPKFWAARLLVDDDGAHTQQSIEQIRTLMAKRPEIVVIPAHDGTVQQALGYFPAWVK